MADITESVFGTSLLRRWKDMADGTYAEAVGSVGVPLATATATIANGATESNAISVDGKLVAGIAIPAEYDGTALSIKNAADSTNYFTEYADGADVSYTVAASKFLHFKPPLVGLTSIKLVAGTAQTGATALTVVLVP